MDHHTKRHTKWARGEGDQVSQERVLGDLRKEEEERRAQGRTVCAVSGRGKPRCTSRAGERSGRRGAPRPRSRTRHVSVPVSEYLQRFLGWASPSHGDTAGCSSCPLLRASRDRRPAGARTPPPPRPGSRALPRARSGVQDADSPTSLQPRGPGLSARPGETAGPRALGRMSHRARPQGSPCEKEEPSLSVQGGFALRTSLLGIRSLTSRDEE